MREIPTIPIELASDINEVRAFLVFKLFSGDIYGFKGFVGDFLFDYYNPL